jgi:hypothetical protein
MKKPDESVEAGPETVMRRRRGKWTAQQRRRIVADSRVAGASVQEVAERHGVRANLLSAWRRQDEASHATKPVKFAAVKERWPHKFGTAPVRWTVYRLRFLISSPSILHPKRSLPPQAAEAPGFFLQFAENRSRIKLQAPRSRSTPGLCYPRKFHAATVLRSWSCREPCRVSTLVVHR